MIRVCVVKRPSRDGEDPSVVQIADESGGHGTTAYQYREVATMSAYNAYMLMFDLAGVLTDEFGFDLANDDAFQKLVAKSRRRTSSE